ncbi:MAG TPA: phosphotransferase family protein [Candidatus Binataceae bacterium]|nr:phosphotransferase family protein [Candidatus Binataceae bacterium]
MALSNEETLQRLTAMVRAKTGDSGARVHSMETLPGHAGFSYSFVVEHSNASQPKRKLVIRISPPDVKISGPADVVRQAKIMASFASTAVPVPPILWWGDEAEFFGRPYFVAGFVDGFKLGEVVLAPADKKRLANKAVATLATLHSQDWESRRSAFGDPITLEDEMKRLDYLLDRPTLDPAVVARGPLLRERLRSTLPANPRLGCVHGDFQWSNILFNNDGPMALIDWEISSIGPVMLDLGWLCFFADPRSFVENSTAEVARFMPLAPDEIVATYTASASFPVDPQDVRWFRAFSAYRFGVITCFNVMLHRRGKRHDPHWEDIAISAPRMFESGLELLG